MKFESLSLWSFLCNGDLCSLSTAVSMTCFTNMSKNHYCNYNIKVCVCVQVKTEKSKMAKIKWKSTCACGNPFYFLKFWLPHPLIFSSSNYQKMLGWTLFKLNISYGEKEKEKKSYLLLAYPACLPFVTFSTGSLFVYLAQQKMDWQKQFQSVVYLFIMILIMNENLYSGTMHSCPVTLHNDVQIIKSINHTLLFIIINRINKKKIIIFKQATFKINM